MAQINARDWIFQVSLDPSAMTPVWVSVEGIESFDLNNSEGEESTDTTTFESAGLEESQAMQRGASCQLEGKIKRTTATTQAPGQVAVGTLAGRLAEASLGGFRFRHTADTTWVQWSSWASLGNNGGGNNDKTSWGATFRRSGAATNPSVA